MSCPSRRSPQWRVFRASAVLVAASSSRHLDLALDFVAPGFAPVCGDSLRTLRGEPGIRTPAFARVAKHFDILQRISG